MSPPGATLGAALDTRRVRPFTWFGNAQDSVGGVKVLTPVWEKQMPYRREVGGERAGREGLQGRSERGFQGRWRDQGCAVPSRGSHALHGAAHGAACKGWLARGRGEAQRAWLPWVLRLFCFLPKPGKAVWGESGELVCTKPIPCQPTHFWNDENGSKYRKAYFSRFPGTWAAGADSAWPGPRAPLLDVPPPPARGERLTAPSARGAMVSVCSDSCHLQLEAGTGNRRPGLTYP